MQGIPFVLLLSGQSDSFLLIFPSTLPFIIILSIRYKQDARIYPTHAHENMHSMRLRVANCVSHRSPSCLCYRDMPSRRLQRWFLASQSTNGPDPVSPKPLELLSPEEWQTLFGLGCKMPRYDSTTHLSLLLHRQRDQ